MDLERFSSQDRLFMTAVVNRLRELQKDDPTKHVAVAVAWGKHDPRMVATAVSNTSFHPLHHCGKSLTGDGVSTCHDCLCPAMRLIDEVAQIHQARDGDGESACCISLGSVLNPETRDCSSPLIQRLRQEKRKRHIF